jgi:hypothetical protein
VTRAAGPQTGGRSVPTVKEQRCSQVHLRLGNAFHESLSILPMDMDVGDDLILGWNWISSHDLHYLYRTGHVDLRSG